jgi:hypothetical protein
VIHAATQASSRFDMTDRRRVLLDTTAFIDYVQTKSSREVSADGVFPLIEPNQF